jgi:hypothetical protein
MLKVIAVAALAALAVAGVGYATAGDGNDRGGVQAWAQVDPNGGAPQLVQSDGIVSVSSPQSGVYCLKGAHEVDLAHSAPVASQEVSLSTTIGLAEPRRVDAPNSSCAAGELQIDTWDASNTATPTLVNTVGFDVVVP